VSYILDALKKSEHERDRDQGGIPDIQSIHHPLTGGVRHSSNVWPYVAITAALLVVLAGFFVWMPSESAKVTQESELPDKEILAQLNNIDSQEDASRESPFKIQKNIDSVDDSSKPSAKQVTPQKKQVTKKSVKTKPKPKQQVIFATEPLDSSAEPIQESSNRSAKSQFNSNTVYKVAELPLSVRKNVPPITFSGHVFSSTPNNRSVMINGNKMREGQSVTSQLTLKEITPTGAIFKFNGYIFSLSALQDWKFK